MRFDLRAVNEHPRHFRELFSVDVPEIEKPTEVECTIQLQGDSYILDGTVSIVYNLVCARCLVPFSRNETVPLHVLIKKGIAPDKQDNADDETDVVYLSADDDVDISEYLRGEILLDIPVKAVCSEECKGMCPVCGTNLNEKQCHCSHAAIDAKWAKLNEIKRELYGGD